MDFRQRITEGRREHKKPPARGYGSGPSTRHERLGGDKSGRGAIWKRTVTSTGTRPSGRGMTKGEVSYSRTTDKPRGGTGPLRDVPLSTNAPIEGRIRDVVKKVRQTGQKAAGAVKSIADKIRGKKASSDDKK